MYHGNQIKMTTLIFSNIVLHLQKNYKMKKYFPISLILQAACIVLDIIHVNKSQGLGSDFMFGVLLFSLANGVFLLWNAFRNKEIYGMQKLLGIVLGSIGFVAILMIALYVTTGGLH